jgi:hypothetical protein
MISTTVGKVLNAYNALAEMATVPVDGDVALTISLNMSRMKTDVEEFDKRRKPLVDELLVLNDDGSIKEFKNRAKWDESIKRMTDVKTDVNAIMFDVDRIKSIRGITGSHINAIEWLINFPKEEKPNDPIKEVA